MMGRESEDDAELGGGVGGGGEDFPAAGLEVVGDGAEPGEGDLVGRGGDGAELEDGDVVVDWRRRRPPEARRDLHSPVHSRRSSLLAPPRLLLLLHLLLLRGVR